MLSSIQLLRAIAAWAVVVHHFMQIFFDFQSTYLIGRFFSRFGANGVDLFFVISGFVIYHATQGKTQSPWQFIVYRLARVAPLYWFFTLLTAVLVFLYPGFYPQTAYEPIFLLKSLFFLPAVNPSGIGVLPVLTVGWTLNFEMLFYLAFALALFLPRQFQIFGIFLGVLAAHWVLPEVGGVLKFYSDPIVHEFLLGVLVAMAYRRNLLKKIMPALAVGISLLAVIWILAWGRGHSPVHVGVPSALLVMSALSQEAFFSKFKIFRHLGDWSYSTYLCHVPILLGSYQLHTAWGWHPLVFLGLSCILISFASWFSYSQFEIKWSSWIKRSLS